MTLQKAAITRLDQSSYESLHKEILRRDGWRCQSCGTMANLEVHHKEFRSHSGADGGELDYAMYDMSCRSASPLSS